MNALLALAPVSTWTLEGWLVAILIIAGAVAVALIVLRVLGYTVPPWVWQIAWICAAVFLGILALRFLFSL